MKITLLNGEYRNIFELASTFKGDTATKLAALKIMEKISKIVSDNTTKNEDNEPVMPDSIEVDFTSNELEGYWKGIVGYIGDSEIGVDKVIVIKAIASKLKMSKRFEKLEETLTIQEDSIPLDD